MNWTDMFISSVQWWVYSKANEPSCCNHVTKYYGFVIHFWIFVVEYLSKPSTIANPDQFSYTIFIRGSHICPLYRGSYSTIQNEKLLRIDRDFSNNSNLFTISRIPLYPCPLYPGLTVLLYLISITIPYNNQCAIWQKNILLTLYRLKNTFFTFCDKLFNFVIFWDSNIFSIE